MLFYMFVRSYKDGDMGGGGIKCRLFDFPGSLQNLTERLSVKRGEGKGR